MSTPSKLATAIGRIKLALADRIKEQMPTARCEDRAVGLITVFENGASVDITFSRWKMHSPSVAVTIPDVGTMLAKNGGLDLDKAASNIESALRTARYRKRDNTPSMQWTVGRWYMTRNGGLAQYQGKWKSMDLHSFLMVPDIPHPKTLPGPVYTLSRLGEILTMVSPGGEDHWRKVLCGFDVVTDDTTLNGVGVSDRQGNQAGW